MASASPVDTSSWKWCKFSEMIPQGPVTPILSSWRLSPICGRKSPTASYGGVHHYHDAAPAKSQADILGLGLSKLVVAVEDPHVFVAMLGFFQPFGRAVGGAVVHNYGLGVDIVAPQQKAVDAAFHVLQIVAAEMTTEKSLVEGEFT